MKVGKESEKLEFKKTTSELKEGIISITAILNKHGGGELFFGIRNDGTSLGQTVSDKTLREISQAISNHIEPKIYPKITEVVIDDKQCVYVEFSGEDAPYFAYGRAYIRIADEDRVMSPTELEVFILKKNAKHDFWDCNISNKTSTDVDESVLREYMDRANRAGRIDFSYTTREDVLHKLSVIEDGKLKNAAFALFGGSPMLEMQMAIFATNERLTFNDIKRESGSVISLVKTAEKYIRSNIRWKVVLDGSLQRKEIPEIPMDAVREALINSYCHRDYRSSQNNEITIYSNRLEIYNPGTFPDGLTPRDFIEGYERSIKRNPLLAQLMYYSKDIESFGTGLKRITMACKTAGVKIDFQLLKKGFAVVFYRPDDHKDAAFSDGIIGKNIGDSIGINTTQVQIMTIMSKNAKISAKAIASEIGIAPRNVEANIKSLKQAGLIERVGSAKGGHWVVKRPE
jgi:ATP-dependent DNA helicase RecG